MFFPQVESFKIENSTIEKYLVYLKDGVIQNNNLLYFVIFTALIHTYYSTSLFVRDKPYDQITDYNGISEKEQTAMIIILRHNLIAVSMDAMICGNS